MRTLGPWELELEGLYWDRNAQVLQWNSGITGESGVREVAALGFCHMHMSAVTQDRHLLFC